MKTINDGDKVVLTGKEKVRYREDGEVKEAVFPEAIIGEIDRFGFVTRNGKSPKVVFGNGAYSASLQLGQGNSHLSLKITSETQEGAIALWNSLVIAHAQ